MTTTYDEVPRFRYQVRAAPLIVIARVIGVADVRVEPLDRKRVQVQTIYRLEVEDALRGEPPKELLVRVVGGETEDAKTASTVTLEADESVLCLLTPEVGPERRENAFVPYFQSVFRMKKDRVLIDELTAKDLAEEGIEVEGGTVALDDVRALIEGVMREEEREAARLMENEPEEIRRLPLPDVTEAPTDDERLATLRTAPTGPRAPRSERPGGEEVEDLFGK